ncbi:hypothetical protein [Amycolatopsis regifaucium]|uniref:Uncharacterized protein n=1 Tax=Amycolatopsis regifaucium TaxID=546365 RepID=A0A154MCB7_9PSEU|nr:hypothetical protein [Amycolatopsis regifaucium]KZB82238.1 hypothetical protein AVL48_09925 [Amycolatopsis regifaucium]OKA05692.1 hypothetical protein ATP06_0221055 [Amycolatopsis regifaucium]SFG87147.1 hypothetical protein SAMN04489731_101769 [Amycolatopsis regifaucium]
MTILTDLRERTRTWHRGSYRLAQAFAVITVLCVLAMLIDQRTLNGAPLWAKPFKFAVSAALYFFTWSWLVSLLPKFRRTANWLANTLVVIFAAEYVLVVFQTVRVRASHFNAETSLDNTIFQVMGGMIAMLWVINLVLTIAILFTRLPDRATTWAARIGAVLGMVGISLAVLMNGPTPEQQAALDATGTSTMIGAHTVGLPDGGPGLPILGWSTVGGDLRIPHFLGLHALQALPLLALALGVLAARYPRLRDGLVRTRLVLVAGAGYAGLLALLTWQALRGQSIVAPDGQTLTAFALLLAGVAVSGLIAIGRPSTDRELEASPR